MKLIVVVVVVVFRVKIPWRPCIRSQIVSWGGGGGGKNLACPSGLSVCFTDLTKYCSTRLAFGFFPWRLMCRMIALSLLILCPEILFWVTFVGNFGYAGIVVCSLMSRMNSINFSLME